ncbi:MAG: cell wall-binding repeat-containing protein, partial [Tissierellia bacterium]|nr:cell wall-binding repeat-containing protein [Tissierellia bacterium]
APTPEKPVKPAKPGESEESDDVIEGTNPEDPARPGYTRVEFFADDVIKATPTAEAKKGILKSAMEDSTNTAVKYLYYDVKEELTFEKVPVPIIIAKDGYTVKAEPKNWAPELPDKGAFVKDLTEKAFVAKYDKKDMSEPTVPEQPGNEIEKPDKDRIFGKDRIETAIKVSKEKFGHAKTVIIARYDVFADALVAGPLAYALDAPILLTKPTELLPEVAAEIERLGANHIIIVGGLASIDENVEEALRKYDDNLERLEGPTRYETSVKVADRLKEANGGRTKAVVATGETYPDALSVGPFAAVEGMPILLVRQNEVPELVSEAFERLQIEKIYISGGEASVGEAIEKDMPTIIERFSGDDRYATAVDIAKKTNSEAKNIYLASGELFADALVAGPAAAKENAPILLTRRNEAPQVLKDYFKDLNIEKLTIIGGENTITDESVESIFK